MRSICPEKVTRLSYRYLTIVILISLAFSCWFNAISLTKFTISYSDEETESVVDYASASNDIKTDSKTVKSQSTQE